MAKSTDKDKTRGRARHPLPLRDQIRHDALDMALWDAAARADGHPSWASWARARLNKAARAELPGGTVRRLERETEGGE
jgi:L-alanine-DL-glutamate epimerase-like enolase superfamily enzyme